MIIVNNIDTINCKLTAASEWYVSVHI